jgi:hypothetical protein
MSLQYQALTALSGDFNGDAAGTTASGTALATRTVEPGTLSAYFDISSKTNTFTIAGYWEVSDDNTTFRRVYPLNNAATVVFATGTGSAVTYDGVIAAPLEVYGWKYVRATVVAGVTTGADAADSYAIYYRWLKRNAFERIT